MATNTTLALNESEPPRLFTVKQFVERQPWATIGGIRHIIFLRESNGFGPAFLKLGRRILVHEGKFLECLEAQNGTPTPDSANGA